MVTCLCSNCAGSGWTIKGWEDFTRQHGFGPYPETVNPFAGDCEICGGTGKLEEDMAEEELSFQKKIDELMED